jgi:adenylate cyclase
LADRFDGALDDIFELQDQVASTVVGAIEPKLRRSEIERSNRKTTESLDAYDLYLRAHALYLNFTKEGMREAVYLLTRALAVDPCYAPAAELIGVCRITQGLVLLLPLSDTEVAESVHLARQAIETGKDDPDALWMAGYTLSVFAGDHATAATVIDRALTLNPNSAYAWTVRGWVSCYRNQPSFAIDAFHRAMRLSPLDPLGFALKCGLALAHLVAGTYVEAIEWAERSLLEQPRYSTPIRIKAVACAHLDRNQEAHECLNRLLDLQPGLTIASYKEYAAVFFSPEILDRYVEGLRKAGLPEE